ncbi:MAG: D-glycero-beta-D-manno-heptose 1-phosphate adenylyltransferase [Halobacteriovoraceae bacterium]|nr:D-glycero-beta-D-manno-heptose 1-phosphate adenylyltransferase [Halobacteriovoraceae bacterium]|tara:strand:+ start:663 stop:1106 length:444 start_codon:yes stop_codon:yes gene_type:complete
MNLEEFRNSVAGKKVVFTNGCFDILHRGHVSYLNEAKSLGDILVVGLNSDASVKRLKGESRPVNSERDRKFVLENLKAVDYVFIFEQDTPLELIKKVSPYILVKGGDWKPDQIVGSEFVLQNGGQVKSLQFVDGFSTTSTIEKINNA